MSSNIDEQKNKKKSFKFFGIENASPTFQKIITKYRSKKKDIKAKPKSILAYVEKARFKAEKIETENEYLMKELRNNRKFTENLIFLYGQRAEKHYNEINEHKEFKTKVKKNYFFTPQEILKLSNKKNRIKNKKGSLPLLTDYIIDKKKSIFSPKNLSKNKFTFNKDNKTSSKNSTGMLGFYNTTGNIKTVNNESNKIKNNINKIPNRKFTENNISQANNNKNDFIYIKTKTDNFRDQIESLNYKTNTLYKNKTNNDFHLKRMMYMNELAQIDKDFLRTKNEFTKHFKTNDYGCNFSKLEYEYLKKKYFNI